LFGFNFFSSVSSTLRSGHAPKSEFLEQRKDSFFVLPIRVNPYTYLEKFCYPAQIFAARERKEHKEKEFFLCDLCVLCGYHLWLRLCRAESIRASYCTVPAQ
jgi:hypothetical protein